MDNGTRCSVEGCETHVYAKALCSRHYQRARIYGDPEHPSQKKARGGCAVDGCEQPHDARGYCAAHYYERRTHGDPDGRVDKWDRGDCAAPGCDKPERTMTYCNMHYKRLQKFGSLDDPRQSESDRFWSKVNKTDDCWEWTSAKTWGYGAFHLDGGVIGAHRYSFIDFYGYEPDWDIDHICGNRGCVRPDHLRHATRKQNMENLTKLVSDNTSGYRGVYFSEGRWRAQITHNKKTTYIGSFSTAAEAGEAARQARLKLYTHNEQDRIA